MRFVDTPGIITTKGTGKDNRSDIKDILRKSMKRPNTMLCVLMEPKEFSTNQIFDFCDDTFPKPKRNWMEDSIFLMTKFDKQLADSRSGSKANKFFREFLVMVSILILSLHPHCQRKISHKTNCLKNAKSSWTLQRRKKIISLKIGCLNTTYSLNPTRWTSCSTPIRKAESALSLRRKPCVRSCSKTLSCAFLKFFRPYELTLEIALKNIRLSRRRKS